MTVVAIDGAETMSTIRAPAGRLPLIRSAASVLRPAGGSGTVRLVDGS